MRACAHAAEVKVVRCSVCAQALLTCRRFHLFPTLRHLGSDLIPRCVLRAVAGQTATPWNRLCSLVPCRERRDDDTGNFSLASRWIIPTEYLGMDGWGLVFPLREKKPLFPAP